MRRKEIDEKIDKIASESTNSPHSVSVNPTYRISALSLPVSARQALSAVHAAPFWTFAASSGPMTSNRNQYHTRSHAQ